MVITLPRTTREEEEEETAAGGTAGATMNGLRRYRAAQGEAEV
jgi:hypothetical protein